MVVKKTPVELMRENLTNLEEVDQTMESIDEVDESIISPVKKKKVIGKS